MREQATYPRESPANHHGPQATLDQQVAAALEAQKFTPEIARQLTVDPYRSNQLVTEIALGIAAESTEMLRVPELLEFVRSRLSQTIAEVVESDERREYRRIPGIERVGSGEKSAIDFGLGYDWKVQLYDNYTFTRLSDSNIAAANLLGGLNISPEDRRKLTSTLLPTVLQDDGEYVLKKVNPTGETEDLNRGEPRKGIGFKLSEIVSKRKTDYGSFPVYSKEDLALYLEAVLHSEMTQEEKNRFIDELLQTREFDEDILYLRPPYDGGDIKRHEYGTRIFLPTGQSMRIRQDNRLRLDAPRQGYYSGRSDVVFVMALVERGRLPVKALNSIYTVNIYGDVVRLSNTHMLDQDVSIDLSKPFDKQIDFLPLYLSFLLTRDPRINADDRKRLRQYFGNNIDVKIVPSK